MKQDLQTLCERLVFCGAQSLSDVELIATIIGSSHAKQNLIGTAQSLLDYFGSIRALINATSRNFGNVTGSNITFFAKLQATKELFRRNELIQLKKYQQITHSEQAFKFLKNQLRDEKNEIFAALFLDSQHRVIAYEQLFKGSINSTSIYLRPIIERIISHNAAAIILAHNHPSGISDASMEDFALTKHIKKIIRLLDTNLLDHVVIGDNEAFSIIQEQKWLC